MPPRPSGAEGPGFKDVAPYGGLETRCAELSMKRLAITILPFLLLATSCVAVFPFDGIVGNGKVITSSLDARNFTAVKNYSSAKVIVRRGTVAMATVTVDENILEALDIKVDNGSLNISTKPGKSIMRYSTFKVTVTMPLVEEFGIYGSGEITASDRFGGDTVKLAIHGSGGINGSFDAEKIDAYIGGSGGIDVAGTTGKLVAMVAGSGSIAGDSLTADDALVSINGSGSASLRVHELLDARIYGSGSINYYGSPARLTMIDAGSGQIRQISR